MASLRCFASMFAAPSRSAIVRDTFKMRSCARAESPSLTTAFSSSFSPSGDIAQCLRIIFGAIWALQYVFFSPLNLSSCRAPAAITRARTAAESSEDDGARNSLYFTAGTSMWMSMRSSSGPEIFDTYRWIIGGVQWQSRVGSPKYPQGHGFIAAASINREGNVTDIAARAIVTEPSSSG